MDALAEILHVGAAGLTLAWLVSAQRRRVVCAMRRFLALPRLQQTLVIFAICILTVCAQKSGSNVVFNAEVLEEGRRGEIIELSNNRIIESEEASASGSVISHGGTETRSEDAEDSSNKVEAVSRPLQERMERPLMWKHIPRAKRAAKQALCGVRLAASE
jgi:hypothetical protein